jgi:hypothetical protein
MKTVKMLKKNEKTPKRSQQVTLYIGGHFENFNNKEHNFK